MQIKRSGIFIILTCLFSLKLFAQTHYENFVPNVFGKSPNTTEFQKYGDYPTNLFSGLPDISIPLYTVESGGLKVPITLSYHAAGIKVDQASTWVGLGWSIEGGGSVSRTVYGMPDDAYGYFYHYRHPYSYSPTVDGDVTELYSIIVRRNTDSRPDIFSYNLPGGLNGKFFFNALESYKLKLIPYSPIKIQNTAAHIGYDTAKFAITDPHGNEFKLGYQYREVSSTLTTSSRPSVDATTTWMLESMISQNKHDTIRFTYQKQSVRMPEGQGQSLTVQDQGVLNNSYDGGVYATNDWIAYQSNVSTTVNEQDPKEIFFKNGKVVFKLSGSPRTDLQSGTSIYALDTVQVFAYDFSKRQYETNPQKSIVFKRSTFAVMSGGTARMRLDSIQVLDKARSIVQTYRFTYDNTPLPSYSSYSRDYWGYYNGKMDNPAIINKTLIPKTQVIVDPGNVPPAPYSRYIGSDDSTSRYPDTVKMQAGILKRIDYPTGGYTTFAFETNRYDDYGTPRFTGGLRITAISSYSSQTAVTPILKTYRYNAGSPNFPSGGGYLGYGFFNNQIQVAKVGGAAYLGSKRVRTFYSEPNNSLTGTDGNPVAYTNITEYIGDPVTNIGKTVYSYRSNSDVLSSASSSGSPVVTDYFYKRGQLLSKTDFLRKSDGSYQAVRSEAHDYSAFTDSTYENVGTVVRQTRQSETEGGVPQLLLNGNQINDDRYSYMAVGYAIRTGDSYPISDVVKTYDQNDPTKFQTSTVEYKYDNFKHQQVSRTRTIDSKGNTKVTVSKYPADYLIGSATTTNDYTLDKMLESNMQAEEIEKWDSVKNVSTSLNAVVGGQLNLFQTNTTSVVPQAIKKLNVSSPITNFIPASVISGNITADSRYVQMIRFDQYEYATNNLLQYTPRNAGPTFIIWDYNNQHPIAQVKNATLDNGSGNRNSAYTSFEADGKGNWSIVGSQVTERYAPTGNKVLYNGSASLSNFDLSKPHVVTYWANGSAATVYAGSTYPGTALRTVKGWTLYRHNIPALTSSSSLSIYGPEKIDELKTYPADAQMVTYTFDTDGLSEITDEKDQIGRFEYDPAQRLQFAKDWQYNIVKGYGYHNYNMNIGSDAIAATTFTRSNCPSGTNPGSTTYSVAANTYYSSTKPSANALAQYDLQTNGQAKANDPAICGCPIRYITFTMKDQTGLGTYQAGFSGDNTLYFNMPSGTSTGQVPAGTYTLQISTIGTQIKHFQLGNRPVITGHTATFNDVVIDTGSSDLTLTIY